MPSTLFDSAGLAIVAYAQVDGATGQSAGTTAFANSGVYTTRTATGVYDVYLPTGLTQDSSRDLIFVQPKTTPKTTAIRLGYRVSADLFEVDATRKQVQTVGIGGVVAATTAIDSDFDVLVLRTTLP